MRALGDFSTITLKGDSRFMTKLKRGGPPFDLLELCRGTFFESFRLPLDVSQSRAALCTEISSLWDAPTLSDCRVSGFTESALSAQDHVSSG